MHLPLSLDGVKDRQKGLVLCEHRQVAEQLVAAAHLHVCRVLQYDGYDLTTYLIFKNILDWNDFRHLEIVGKDDEIWTQLLRSLHPVTLLHPVVTCLVIAGANLAMRAMCEE